VLRAALREDGGRTELEALSQTLLELVDQLREGEQLCLFEGEGRPESEGAAGQLLFLPAKPGFRERAERAAGAHQRAAEQRIGSQIVEAERRLGGITPGEHDLLRQRYLADQAGALAARIEGGGLVEKMVSDVENRRRGR
jgi:hypothetical protein